MFNTWQSWQNLAELWQQCGGDLHPTTVQSLTYWWRGVWKLADVLYTTALVNSDNIAAVACLMHNGIPLSLGV